jgi:GTPase
LRRSQINDWGSGIKLLGKDKIFAVKARVGRDGQEGGFETRTRTLVLGPYRNATSLRKAEAVDSLSAGGEGRSPAARLSEAFGLAQAIGREIVASQIVPLGQIRPATYIGKGKVDELAALIGVEDIALVVMDCALTPGQQRNLEKALAAKVIDRTGLILEIFGRRARTREGALQVELAHLAYQKSRLVRSWTHLERQRGGFGFLGGPGETQIEADRRLIEERMIRIGHDLENVKRMRGLHRKSRRAVPYPVVAMVGYTNAGKSTLFNQMTKASVVAEEKLFATVDPTSRGIKLPHGSQIILSDTVGFISDLPTLLIKAFRATLEEVVEADVILHVRDIAHADSEAQRADVEAVLESLGIDPASDRRLMEVWNKCDLLGESEACVQIGGCRTSRDKPILVSALTGQGIADLRAAIETRLAGNRAVFDISLDPADGAELNWLHKNTEILRKVVAADGMLYVRIRVGPQWVERVRRKFFAAAAS